MSSSQYTAAKKRLEEIGEQAQEKLAAFEAGDISNKQFGSFIGRAESEADGLRQTIKTYEHANRIMAGNDIRGMDSAPAGFGETKGLAPADHYLQSPVQATPEQRQQLEYAMRAKMPCTIEIEQKGWRSGVGFKAAMQESSFSPALPGVEIPQKYLSFPYEPTRLSSYLLAAPMDRASAFWISETEHAAEAAPTAEGATKPDLGPTLVNNEVVPTKVAGQFSYTLEIEMDVPGGVSGFILNSLQRSIINQENDLLLNAVKGTANSTFDGWLKTSGTMAADGTSDANGMDTIIKAAAAMRSNTASFAEPDLLVLSPKTVADLQTTKDTEGRYLNDIVFGAGPGGLTWNGDAASGLTRTQTNGGVTPQGHEGGNLHLAGIPVVQSTQIADNTGLLLSIRNGGGVFWLRQNMFVMYDPYTGLGTNTYRYVAEERIALSVPRPAAVSVISNLAVPAA